MWLAWLVVVLTSLWLLASRLLPWLIASLASLYLGRARVRIGGFGRRLEVFQLSLELAGLEVKVGTLRLISSVLSSEASNLVTLIATDVVVTVLDGAEVVQQPEPEISIPPSRAKSSRTLLLIAQFLGLQVRGLQVVVTRLPSLPSCHLEVKLGELRLDSSVIHRTRLSLALHTYQGSLSLLPSPAARPLLQATFAFQASIQALVGQGRVTSVEDVNLDVDGLSLQHLQGGRRPASQDSSNLSSYAAYIPRVCQVKAEAVSGQLEHTDGLSSLRGELALLYLCSKCTEAPRAGHLPDSHFTGQLSGLRVVAGCEQQVLALSRFQVLVQKEAVSLHSDTQLHELTACYSELLDPWLAPVSWLVRVQEQRKAAAALAEDQPTSSLVGGLHHSHQLDAWNSDLTVLEGGRRWEVSLHQLNLSTAPGAGGATRQVSGRQAKWSLDGREVLTIGQVDTRLQGPGDQQLDLMVTGSSAQYRPELVELGTRIQGMLRPLLLQLAVGKKKERKPPSLAFVVSQSKVAWGLSLRGQWVGLAAEVREMEGEGGSSRGRLQVTGLKLSQLSGGQEPLVCLALPSVALVRREQDIRVTVAQRVRLAWQPSTHLTMLKAYEDVQQIQSLFAPISPPAPSSPSPPLTLHLTVSEKVSCSLHTGRHTLKLLTSSLSAKLAPVSSVSWLQAPRTRIKLDRLVEGRRSYSEVVSAGELVLSVVPRSEKLSSERRRMEGATVGENKCLVVAVASLEVTQPYEFPLHQVFFGEVMGCFKWLKNLHRKGKKKEEGLPKDILINIKSFRLELQDDPFEVKLRDNYELKEDEYLESQKRLKVLEQRIEEMRRKNFMFPKEKIEELVANLKVKNAEIYVQRAKRFCVPRTRLLEWVLLGLEVMVVADPAMQGRERVLAHLKEADKESPWPPDQYLTFSTLWCRWIKMEAASFSVQLRDFPQQLLDIRTLALWGRMAGAEMAPGKRSTRSHKIEVGGPWEEATVERSLVPLKLYYDLACDVETLSFAYGSCWEPAMTQCSIAMSYLTGRSWDPSPSLPWWDKARLLLHGRLLLVARSTQLLLHASLDPYNTTEEMAIGWTDMELDWTEGQVKVRGTLDVYVRTASKYDDGHLMHLPALSLLVKMEWVCLANPLDHHSVLPCAPDKLPEYSHNQDHDSFRAFRSNHVNLSAQMETRSSRGTRGERPKLDMFSSTLRWFENLKFIFSGASRPIRRGEVNVGSFKFLGRPKKPHFSRHLKRVGLSVTLHQFQVNYWTSFSQKAGILLNVARGINLSTEHLLTLVHFKDGLKRRARADWQVSFINGELTTSDLWIQSALEQPSPPSSPTGDEGGTVGSRDTLGSREGGARNTEKSFFFCVEKVVYMRMGHRAHFLEGETDRPTHQLVIHGARVAWTQSNRDMWFALYESWRRTQILRKNVSSDALKSFHGEGKRTEGGGTTESGGTASTPFTSPTPHSAPHSAHSPFAWGGRAGASSSTGVSMLDRLLQEGGGTTPTVPCEDMESEEESKQSLEAMVACTTDDIVHRHACIELVNSQVLLKGIETPGYVIISAARAVVRENMHRPVWKEKTLLSKTTWSGGLETMQYYATVHEEGGRDLDNILWLTVDNIGEGEQGGSARLPGPAGLVGSGKAVGGVVSQVVGDVGGDQGIQLQRIVSRCKAEFFYVSYGDTELEAVEGGTKMVGPSPATPSWSEQETAVNAFSFVHHDLNASTNSLQYAMLLDIVNNLVLHTEPRMKERTDRYLRMRYQFMLEIDNIEEQRKKIIKGQNQLRQLVCKLRQSEKDIYMLSMGSSKHRNREERRLQLEQETTDIKERLSLASEDLDMRIRCYRETQMASSQRSSAVRGDQSKEAGLRRRHEICFSKATVRLTEIDGQLGIADLNISKFLFTRSSLSDDSVENLLEMGEVHVKNLLPNQVYEHVLTPTKLGKEMPVDRQRTVRVYWRDRGRVGGISVRDHFEINIAPLTIGITAHFYKKMMNFFFPEQIEEEEADRKQRKKAKKLKGANTSFYVACPDTDKDDVEKMKDRAERNKLFIYIKIPEVPIIVSYKGLKEKNQITDLADFHLQLPTFEYHNVTWTWLDLLLAVKKGSRDSLLTQVKGLLSTGLKLSCVQLLKQKFVRRQVPRVEEQEPDEEEKARLLLGKQVGGEVGGIYATRVFRLVASLGALPAPAGGSCLSRSHRGGVMDQIKLL